MQWKKPSLINDEKCIRYHDNKNSGRWRRGNEKKGSLKVMTKNEDMKNSYYLNGNLEKYDISSNNNLWLSHKKGFKGWFASDGHVPGSQGGELIAPAKKKDKIDFSTYLERTEKGGKDKPRMSKAERLSKDINTVIKETATATNKVLSLKNKSKNELNTKKLSDEQLSRAIRRIELERRYNSLTSEETNEGRKHIMDALDIIGSVTAVAASGIAIATGIYNLNK